MGWELGDVGGGMGRRVMEGVLEFEEGEVKRKK